MSFEGYREYECACGATDAADVYDNEPTSCRHCGGRWSRIRMIDQTNGHDVGEWRKVEFRAKFGDYVARGYCKNNPEWLAPPKPTP